MRTLQTNLALAGKRFHAWWEGYTFDDAVERKRLARAHGVNIDARRKGIRPEEEIAQSIWGAGRLDPGDTSWTLRFARGLGISAKSTVVVLGAGAGAPLRDLKNATRFKTAGYSRYEGDVRGVDLVSYQQVMSRLNRSSADGALSFFEIHQDTDPKAFVSFTAELLQPNSPCIFVDFTVVRKGKGLKSCFPAPWVGFPKTISETAEILDSGGFRVVDTSDETQEFLPLIAKGWLNWRAAYEETHAIKDAKARIDQLHVLNNYAQMWAERFDALKAGQLQVTRFQARKKI